MSTLSQIVEKQRAILTLIKKGKDFSGIERETALMALDILEALEAGSISPKEASDCFVKIEYALDLDTHERLSEIFGDLLNEGLILDDLGTPFAPDVEMMRKLALEIPQKHKSIVI